jgi:signal transduction histidine kinase
MWSEKKISDLFQACDTDISILDYDDNWFDQSLANCFHQQLVERTGDSDIAYKVGKYTVSDSAKGIAGRLLTGFLTPKVAYKNIGRIARMYTKAAEYTPLKISKNSAILTTKTVAGSKEEAYQCRNRIGMLEAIPMMFDLPHAVIEHPTCQHNSDSEVCEYHISWIEPAGRFNLSLALLAFIGSYLAVLKVAPILVVILFASGTSGIVYSLLKFKSDKRLRTALNDQIEAMRISIDTIERRNQESTLINDINHLINRVRPLQELCNVVSQVIYEEMSYDRVSIFTVDDHENLLKVRAFDGFKDDIVPVLLNAQFNLDNQNSDGFLVKAVLQQKPIFVRNVEDQIQLLSERSQEFVRQVGVKSFIAVPIVFENRALGVIAVDYDNHTDKLLSNNDLELLNNIAKQTAVAFSNALAYEALKRINETLEQKVSDRTAELVTARDEAISANLAKSRFLAGMSHELRTPLNAIIGYAELLREEARDEEMESFVTDLEKISGSGHHLLALINNVLDLAKIEAGKMDLVIETIDMDEFIESIETMALPLARSNSNKFCIEKNTVLEKMVADSTKLRQIIVNIISNACKFTKHGTVVFRIDLEHEPNQDWVLFEVSDTGIGMTSEQVEKVFDEYTQAESTTSNNFGGTGLGLPISKKLCELMNGCITVTSAPDKGTTFLVKIPKKVKFSPSSTQMAV